MDQNYTEIIVHIYIYIYILCSILAFSFETVHTYCYNLTKLFHTLDEKY